MIYCLNKKQTTKLSNIFYQQIISNLYYTINCTAAANLKEEDAIIFKHHIRKIEEKREFLPSLDVSSLISPVNLIILSLIHI